MTNPLFAHLPPGPQRDEAEYEARMSSARETIARMIHERDVAHDVARGLQRDLESLYEEKLRLALLRDEAQAELARERALHEATAGLLESCAEALGVAHVAYDAVCEELRREREKRGDAPVKLAEKQREDKPEGKPSRCEQCGGEGFVVANAESLHLDGETRTADCDWCAGTGDGS
jgi:hypothetical protein